MNDEFFPLDWYLRPNTWPRWTPDATLNGEHAPPKVPARIAFDWDETPTGGLIGRPNPLWSQSNSYWWESIPSAPSASGNGGLLGSLSAQPGSPWLNMGLEPKDALPWLAAGRPIAPTPVPGLPAQTVPHLDSAKYWGAAPSRASAEPPASDNYLSPVPQAPSWDSMTAAPQLNDLNAPMPPPKYLDSPSSTSRAATISGLKCHVSRDKLTCVTPGGIQAVVSSQGLPPELKIAPGEPSYHCYSVPVGPRPGDRRRHMPGVVYDPTPAPRGTVRPATEEGTPNPAAPWYLYYPGFLSPTRRGTPWW